MKRIVQSNLGQLVYVICFGAIAFGSVTVLADDKPDPEFGKMVQPFLKQHCLACHGAKKQESRVRFDKLADFDVRDRHLWTRVYAKLKAGEMPPEGSTQPKPAATKAVLAWIQRQQNARRGGDVRRLNRRELSAALQDVTGLAVDYSEALPADGKLAGFDTGVQSLQDTADSITTVMKVARRAVDGIRFLEPASDGIFEADFRDAKEARRISQKWKAKGAYAKVRGLNRPGEGLLIEPKWLGERGGMKFNIPPSPGRRGILRLKVVVSVFKGDYESIPNPHLWVQVGNRYLERRELNSTKPTELTWLVQTDDLPIEKRGLAITLHNKVEMPYGVDGFENDSKLRPGEQIPGGTGLFRPKYDKKNRKLPAEKRPVPFILLRSISIQPQYVAAWPPRKWKADVGKLADNLDSAKRLLNLWIDRAWRRPSSDTERQRFIAFYQQLRKQGLSFDEALRSTFQSVLLSAPFRFLASPADKDPNIARYAFASRLSFFLSGAPPDAELLQLAKADKLRDPKTLDAEVDRLLADPRSRAFVKPFVWQWLHLGQPITLVMDHIKKQDFRFGRHLKASMQDETVEYIAKLLADNRPAKEIIASDWTMMNNTLARHYGYEGIAGAKLRKVKLRADDPRGGGLLGQAGIQSMLCWMGDNWVIYRGAWTLRHILDAPPPPPPLEVPELNPADAKNRGKSFRQLLVQHQKDANCAVCHKTIDPLGFAFQNFDISGRWRKVEHAGYKRSELDGKIEWRGVGKTRPVDTKGRLPRGEEFSSFAECKSQIVKHYQPDLVRLFLKNLLIYSTGRRPDVADLSEIETIMSREKPGGFRLRNLLKAIVRSRAFRGAETR